VLRSCPSCSLQYCDPNDDASASLRGASVGSASVVRPRTPTATRSGVTADGGLQLVLDVRHPPSTETGRHAASGIEASRTPVREDQVAEVGRARRRADSSGPSTQRRGASTRLRRNPSTRPRPVLAGPPSTATLRQPRSTGARHRDPWSCSTADDDGRLDPAHAWTRPGTSSSTETTTARRVRAQVKLRRLVLPRRPATGSSAPTTRTPRRRGRLRDAPAGGPRAVRAPRTLAPQPPGPLETPPAPLRRRRRGPVHPFSSGRRAAAPRHLRSKS